MGYEVTGCDLEESTAYGKNIFKGHGPHHLDGMDFCLVSPAVLYQNSKHAELTEASRKGILMTWQEFLGKYLTKDKKVICIAGTHGKSTTTAMAGKLLVDAGLDPLVVICAYVPEWNGNARFGKGEYFVIEADEFNNNFLNYHPDIAVINNMEFDHPDFFTNEDEVKNSFDKFKENLVGQKILITEKDSLNKKFNLKVFGLHNQKNANMVFLLGRKLGIKDEDIVKSLESFDGIGRRMELIGEKNGIKIFDDYAHHPTAIKTTLEGLREKYPHNKILAIVEPHGYKRTKALLSNYKGVFDSADKVMIGPIFQARDEADESVSPEAVAIASGHDNVADFNSPDQLIGNCKVEIGNYDVVVVIGAGKSYVWAREILALLNNRDQRKVLFRDLTALKIGGEIKYYKEVKNKDQVVTAVKFAKANNLPIFILGDGTDILASDNEFKGLVIKHVGSKINFEENDVVTAEAGASWDRVVARSVDKELRGIECLSGIPGTVGAAPIQNIGAYGQELKDTFVSLEAYDIEKEKFRTFSLQDCEFGYRESVFKKKDHWQ
jgi:UDP-N-acetylmuramate--alanine ligase